MHRNLLIATLALPCLTAAVHAQSCTFTQECYETEPCAESAFSLALTVEGIETGYSTAPVAWSSVTDTAATYVTAEAGAVNMLTVSGTRGRYAVHLADGPQSITYHGKCEGF